MFFKWVFKTYAAVLIVTNTWNIVMGVFDAAQQVVNQSAGVIIGNTSIDIDSLVGDLQTSLEAMSLIKPLSLLIITTSSVSPNRFLIC